jgi:hypothetical protein
VSHNGRVLSSLDASIREFLRARVPLRAEDVDIEFNTPDKEWSARLTRSTVNLFLFDIRRSVNRGITGVTTREQDGAFSRGLRAPMVKVRYMVTVWTAEPGDEHRVLGDLLSLIAVNGEIPAEYLGGELADLGHPAELSLGAEDGMRSTDLWGPLGVPPRASLELAVVLPARGPIQRAVPVPPSEVDVGLNDRNEPSRASSRRRVGGMIEDPAAKGARIIGPRGTSVVEESGRFLIPGDPGDDLLVEADPPFHIVAGTDSADTDT